MLLELDCGNTLIKWRLLDRQGRVRDRDMAPDLVELQCLLGGQEREIMGCRLVSVRSPAETQVVMDQLTSWLKLHPVLAKSRAELSGVRNGYVDHGKLGMDRWLALVAGYNHCRRACVVIDLGTAVTVDFVDASGQHLGGYIAPGSKLLRTSLQRHTRLIRYDESLRGDLLQPDPGTSTAEAVEFGCDLMLVGFVREQLKVARQILGDEMVVILTGGDAERMADALPETCHTLNDLVFDGLALACPVEID
ncbi:type III pantothenate kinase [Pseudomonas neustonica]|uniref:Type III pantothenate kinase n=1 Tax=Pseudomonas neustonica TaxID=2487346 RepID=A0ABX9XG85_9PSED|nr:MULTISPECIES: type III pantothenate kinase [Pseudomonas]MAB22899.1 pantothenate kinase [Pseudomonadales bacterium]MBA6421758.1 type III pantothenate kinase [Pseudomonas sp. 5Ae-yellow]ROZ81620.1 type III pantothenate kinase [Pseudomonas sp. SSM44]ROZ83386.1 type III pantothenate kinase [Pseudomonas neustonica]|tara:strand:- start:847 stop:1596 length:750 start_codon:yes stop_codon:yes gene_type:complete